MNDSAPRAAFLTSFERHARALRRARAVRHALVGLGLGSCGAAALAAVRFFFLPSWDVAEFVWIASGVAALGGAAGLANAIGRPFDDRSVGLYLDARLGGDDEVTAALAPERPTRLLTTVYERATRRLSGAASLRPPILGRLHLTLPLGVASLLPLLLLAPPEPANAPTATGGDVTRMDELPGLSALERLGELEALDPETERRLEALTERARQLEQRLADGLERRAAQAQIAELRDEVDALKGELVSADEQAGLASAVQEFAKDSSLQAAREALGRGDIVRFDAEMRKLASAAEESSREAARQALERALEAARDKGARALSSALSEQKQRFAEREKSARLLRELASALPGDLDRGLSDAAAGELSEAALEQLADAMEKALESLSDEELATLGERLRKAIEKGELGQGPLEEEQLQRLLESVRRGEGQRELQELLQELARQSESADAAQGLEQAEEGLRRAQRQAAGLLPLPQAARQGGGTPGAKGNSEPGTEGGPGSGPGAGEHDGKTAPVPGEELRALARPRMDPGLPLQGATVGRTAARAGETAVTPQGAPLSGVSAEDLRGVEHSNIPEEYREQVGRYFAP